MKSQILVLALLQISLTAISAFADTSTQTVCGHISEITSNHGKDSFKAYVLFSKDHSSGVRQKFTILPEAFKPKQKSFIDDAIERNEDFGCDVRTCIKGSVTSIGDSKTKFEFSKVEVVHGAEVDCDEARQ